MSGVSSSAATGRRPTEAWLYGSVARGTHTATSDLDILVAGDEAVMSTCLGALVAGLPQSDHLAPRQYTWAQLEQMAAYGSLFLLHLKLEGRPLDTSDRQNRLEQVLAELPPYQLTARDIAGFKQAIADVSWSLEDEGDPLFELGTLATIIRHCSILACYLLGNPKFDTRTSIHAAFEGVGMGSLSRDAVNLYDFRLAVARGYPASTMPTRQLASAWVKHASDFVARVGGLS